mmetsp:Transcript_14137/g.32067  ORF Transcript_14137/g.32067 Transcript_14137/m.32067 type:complete len:164 (+) Transcript_14137:73-564(+)
MNPQDPVDVMCSEESHLRPSIPDDYDEVKISTCESTQDLAVCDACPCCDDYCSLPDCALCQSRREAEPGKTQRSNVYTWCQVRRRVLEGSLWLVAHGNIYDASGYVDEHPGSVEAILKKVGEDCSEDFDFHTSASRRKEWASVRVGRVVKCGPGGPKKECCVM